METAERITGDDTIQSMVVKMSQGNPGALRVSLEVLDHDKSRGFMDLLSLDDMGIRGSSIWLGFKDWAGENLDVFVQGIRDRSQPMIDKIRASGGEAWKGGRS